MAKQAKFTVYEKLSKKQQREIDKTRRVSWGLVKPVTRVKPSAKVYKRSQGKQVVQAYSKACATCFLYSHRRVVLRILINHLKNYNTVRALKALSCQCPKDVYYGALTA